MAACVWRLSLQRRKTEDGANNRIRQWRRKWALKRAMQAWKDSSGSMSREKMRGGIALIKADRQEFKDAAFGWAVAAAWAVSHAEMLELRLAFAMWRENAQVAFYYNLAEEETEARKEAEREADRLMGVAENASRLRKVCDARRARS